ncbi:MAG: ATP-binding protein [Bacteroidota bacterium]
MNVSETDVRPMLTQMIDSSRDPILLLDEQGHVLAVSQSLSRLLGFSATPAPEEIRSLLLGEEKSWDALIEKSRLSPFVHTIVTATQQTIVVKSISFLIQLPGAAGNSWQIRLIPQEPATAPLPTLGKENSLYLEKVLESITDGFLVMNKNGDILFCNQPAARLVRLESPEELIGKNVWIIFPELNALKQYPAYPSIMKDNRSLRFKEYFPAFKYWIELSVYPSDENLVIYFKDVTELVQRKKFQLLEREVLALNANPFKELQEVLDVYISSVAQIYNGLPLVLWQIQGNNLQACSVANVPGALTDIISSFPIQQAMWPAAKAVNEKQSVVPDDSGVYAQDNEFGKLLFDNGFIASMAHPLINAAGECWGVLEIYIQESRRELITQNDHVQQMINLLSILLESKLAQENIRLSNQRYDLISRATNDIIWEWDIEKGLLVKANSGLADFFGADMEKEQVQFRSWKSLLHPDDYERVIRKRNDALRNKQNQYWEDEFRLAGQSGKYNYFYHKAFIVRDADGRAIRLFGATQNITRRKEDEALLIELNKQLKQRADELAASNVELERFAYVASHDMQEPLRMITSFLQLFRKKYQDQIDETAEQYLHFVMDGADRMKRLITDLLEYSRIGSNKGVAESIDTAVLMKEVQEVFVNRIAECEATIVTNHLPVIMGNKTQLFQLFQNLVGNALKYVGKEKPLVTVTGSEEENHFLFSVQDNGIGIKPMFFEKIFVLFQRLHHKHQYSGTGIGLSVCKKIVEKHGGKIWVTSEPDKGSTFYFTISKKLEQHAPGFLPENTLNN